MVEAEATDWHLSKADSGDHAKPALSLISARGTKGADELSARKGAGVHVIPIIRDRHRRFVPQFGSL
jgi:hypothetical protein